MMLYRLVRLFALRSCDSGSRCGHDEFHTADLTRFGRWYYSGRFQRGA